MKTNQFKHNFLLLFLFLLAACSTRKDTILSRNYHALTTRDNVLYNGKLALDKGVFEIKNNQKDNFWKRLSVEKMELGEVNAEDKKIQNPNFEIAEAKATKAIQKHSMDIGGREKNYQIDEAYLLLGKARYYDQRYFPSLEAFNYILYKYPTSSTINPAKIWREKTNMRLGNEEQVLKNITKLLQEKKLKKQVVADANALLADCFLNLEQKDSAIVKLKIAEKKTKGNAEKARYRFILGQLYQELEIRDTALIYFEAVIDLNRKVNREYLMQAHAKKAQLFDFEKGNKEEFLKKYNKLIANRENRLFKGILYYEMGGFYEKSNNQEFAEKSYNASLRSNPKDDYLIASNYRNLGDMYFKKTDYVKAAKYYDSTLVKIDVKSREHIHFKKVRNDLDEVIKFESIAKANDSILNIVAMSDANRILYYQTYIDKLKKDDEEKRLLEEKQKQIQKNIEADNLYSSDDTDIDVHQEENNSNTTLLAPPPARGIPSNNNANVFYFYNPSTVAFGKLEFKKKFGKRALTENWKLPKIKIDEGAQETDNNATDSETKDTKAQETLALKPQYTTEFYIQKLPKTQVEIDSIAKERNFAYYQLGLIYKEKFKEYKLASTKLETLLEQNPEQKLVLPSLYNLYKIYQIIDSVKAEAIKNQIASQYPDSRYAQIINNKNPSTASDSETVQLEYIKWFKLYQEEQFVLVLEKINSLIIQYFGDEIVPKYELLKANIIGKLNGLEAYKKAMLFVADNYPSSEEGKNAREILTKQIPLLEQMNFATTESKKWKILYKVDGEDEKTTMNIEENLKKLATDEKYSRLTYFKDIYTEKENFIVIQGINSEALAKNVATILKEDKNFKITESAIIISSDNYRIVQIKKNLSYYLNFKDPSGKHIEVVPIQVVPESIKKTNDTEFIPDKNISPQENTPPKEDKI